VTGAAAMLSEAEVYEVLRECYDPEIPVNIVDLGLVYGVEVNGGVVNVTMTLTAPGCQMSAMMRQEIEDKLLGLPDCSEANVEIVWDPLWSPHMISEAARKKLGLED
jgi:metal-sulfur cluster biosynthetic enzyme